jgi:hypothetical protein
VQPAILTVPLAFATMVLVSVTDRHGPPRDLDAQMVALHAPEGVTTGGERVRLAA